jgi:hypothetical protein
MLRVSSFVNRLTAIVRTYMHDEYIKLTVKSRMKKRTGMLRDCPNGMRKYKTKTATDVLVVNARSIRALMRRTFDRTRDHLTPITSIIMKPARIKLFEV